MDSVGDIKRSLLREKTLQYWDEISIITFLAIILDRSKDFGDRAC